MADAVAAAIAQRAALIAEAGTGTGKTFAYLVPALLYGGKVIVSTGTKTLQDQLFQRDLPIVRDALELPVTLALLKGRANYVCHHHLERDGGRRSPARRATTPGTCRRSSRSRARPTTGDRGALADVPENATIWPLVTSTRDNCLGGNCAHHADCFVLKARKAALEADVVVVNHHLFFADVMLRDEGLAELLPACNTVVLDEAHQLPGHRDPVLRRAADGRPARRARARCRGRRPHRRARGRRAARCRVGRRSRNPQAAPRARRGARQARTARRRRPGGFRRRARRADRRARPPGDRARAVRRAQRGHRATARSARWRRRRSFARWRHGLVDGPAPVGQRVRHRAWIRWVDVTQVGLAAARLAAVGRRRVREAGRRVRPRLGLHVGDARRRRRLLALPARTRTRRCGDRMLGVAVRLRSRRRCSTCRASCRRPIRASTRRRSSLPRCPCCGRAAAARSCCSRRCARSASRARLLADAFARDGLDWPLLVQGEGSRSELLTRFRELGNAVLLGSASFWEGVDVPGAALSVVVIDKLPFAPPDDPLLAARLERCAPRAAIRSSTISCRRR